MRPGCTFDRISTVATICSCWRNYFFSGSHRRPRAFLMRVLYCNKYNHPFSGTEVYLFELMELMRARGHEVALFSMADEKGEATPYDRHFVPHIDFKERAGIFQKIRRAGHAIYS